MECAGKEWHGPCRCLEAQGTICSWVTADHQAAALLNDSICKAVDVEPFRLCRHRALQSDHGQELDMTRLEALAGVIYLNESKGV